MNIVIVIPTYNEKENITVLLNHIETLGIPTLQVIVVDDASPDGTAELVRRLRVSFPIHLIERSGRQGIGSAYIAGFTRALTLNATHIIEMDADLSHNPNDIPRLIEAIDPADMVIGSRRVLGGKIVGWGPVRLLMSSTAMWLSRVFLHLTPKDVTAGFRCFTKEVLETIHLDAITSNGYAFQEEVLYRVQQAGFTIHEVPVTFLDRQKGKSKLTRKDIMEFFVMILRLRKEKNEEMIKEIRK